MKLLSCSRLFFCVALAGPIAGLTACHSTTGTVSHDPTGYFSILGAVDGDIATIDDSLPVRINLGAPIVVVPGKHRVQVSRGGAVILDREVYVSDLQTLELRLP